MFEATLAVAGPICLAALRTGNLSLTARTPEDAVILLATSPDAYGAVVLEAAHCGHWLDPLIDLTIGDTAKPTPLVLIGASENFPAQSAAAAQLALPFTPAALQAALSQAGANVRALQAAPDAHDFADKGEIRIRYQPIVRLRDMRPVSVEVLARLITDDGRTIGPAALIDAMSNAERSMSLTQFIMAKALAEYIEQDFAHLDLQFAFNLPLDAMMHPHLMELIANTKSKAAVPARFIHLELTERHTVHDIEQAGRIIDQLRDSGYHLLLDDITPDMPHLSALMELPFNALKLDRSVLSSAMQAGPNAASAFIAHLGDCACRKNQIFIAEGIEIPEQLNAMQALGVTHGQGFLFARPLPAPALKPWLAHDSRHPAVT